MVPVQAAFGMMLTRRAFGLSAVALPLAAATSAPADPDVVVVGAGVAGLSAARALMDGGRRVQVIEAAARVGGRCYTDTATLGLPFDCGASVLRDADRNPLAGFARLYRFHAETRIAKTLLLADGRLGSNDEIAAWQRCVDAVSVALAEAAEEDLRVAAGDVALPVVDDEAQYWLDTAIAQVGPLSQGIAMPDLSVRDWLYRDEAEPGLALREGVGTLVGRLAEGIPVSVNTRALCIASLGDGQVRVDTERGSIRARAAILTVSPGVIASGALIFDPVLPASTQEGVSGMAMGHLCRVALRYRRGSPALRFGAGSELVQRQTPDEAHRFEIGMKGSPLVTFTAGGKLATDIESMPERDAAAAVLELLRRAIGSEADRGLEAACVSDWHTNPLYLGSVACALPSAPRARDLLAQPIHDRVFLAGEALADKAVQTVHGGYISGQRAARRVLSLLSRKPR